MAQQISEDIEQILLVSRHAPSSHNTQPWRVITDAAKGEVILGFDPSRHLTVGDAGQRELYISLGCFIESFALAAQDRGYRVAVDLLGKPPQQVARLRLKTTAKPESVWSELIRQRRSDRRLYEAGPLPTQLLTELRNLTEGSASLQLLTEAAALAAAADLTAQATLEAMSNPDFRAELASWIRHNWTRRPDGMPAYVQGIPGPVSLLAKTIIKKNKAVAKDQAKKDSKRVLRSAAVGLICIPSNGVVNWLAAGRLYQRACLWALQSDVKTAGISAAVIDTKTARMLQNQAKLIGQPVALLRFGYAKKTVKASPRLSLTDFVSKA